MRKPDLAMSDSKATVPNSPSAAATDVGAPAVNSAALRSPHSAPAPSVATSCMNAVEAAAYLRVSVSWIRKATRRAEVPSFQIGTRVLYDRADLDAFIAERKQIAAWERLRGK
ncbi:MAG: hypothetical protein HMLKMBBP_02520 [Planctomycetes bacterium]|nr:hypothetical protein [Planctomycetota bacterium]